MKDLLRKALISAVVLVCGCREEILHNTSERDANRIITRLQEAHIEAEKSSQGDGRWSISVQPADAAPALRRLEETRTFKDLGEELAAPSIMSSRDEQRFHYERAVARDLERTLSALPGVLDARVHVHLPERDPFGAVAETPAGGSASVLLITSAPGMPSRADLAGLVGGAAGIARERVAVLESAAAEPPPSSGGTVIAALQPAPVVARAFLYSPVTLHAAAVSGAAATMLFGLLLLIRGLRRRALAPAVGSSARGERYE